MYVYSIYNINKKKKKVKKKNIKPNLLCGGCLIKSRAKFNDLWIEIKLKNRKKNI